MRIGGGGGSHGGWKAGRLLLYCTVGSLPPHTDAVPLHPLPCSGRAGGTTTAVSPPTASTAAAMPGAAGGRGHGIAGLLRLSSQELDNPWGSTDMAAGAGTGRSMEVLTVAARPSHESAGPASLRPPQPSLARSSAPVACSWGTIGGDDVGGSCDEDDDDGERRHHGGYGDLLVPFPALPPPTLPGVTAVVTGGPSARKAAAVSTRASGWTAAGAAAPAAAAAGSAQDPIELWSEDDD